MRLILFVFMLSISTYLVAQDTNINQPQADNWDGRWSVSVLFGGNSASNSKAIKEINSKVPTPVSDVNNDNFIDNLSAGFELSYYYSRNWSTSFSGVNIDGFSTERLCFLFCEDRDDLDTSMTDINKYSITQNYAHPLWNNGFITLKAGVTLTTYDIQQSVYSEEFSSFQEIYSSNESKWGGVVGVKLSHLFFDSMAMSIGFDKFTTFNSSVTYLQIGYVY